MLYVYNLLMLLRSIVTCNLIVDEVSTAGTCAYDISFYTYTFLLVDNNIIYV